MDRTSARKLVRTLAAENRRAMEQARIPGHPSPYYVSYLVRDEESWRIQARYGSLHADVHERKRNAFVDVRVGSYRSDHLRDGGLLDNDKDAESYSYVDIPFGDAPDALRHGIWRLTDARYREAVEALLQKRSHELTFRDIHRNLRAFEKREPVVDLRWRDFPEVDRTAWSKYVEQVSATLRRYSDVRDSHAEFQAEHVCRVFVDSEGTRLIQCQPIWSVEVYLWLLSPQGDPLPWTIKHTVTDPAELPEVGGLRGEIRAAVRTLRRLAEAPTLRSFSGPAFLEPVPAGLMIHEAVGHRLEGNRLLSTGEGQTFKGALGRRVLPDFLSVYDDPGLQRFGGRSLVGHYAYDDEGVPGTRADLVRDGRLAGYLTTRVGIDRRHSSNGHARTSYHQRPVSRMAVTVVEARDGLSYGALRRRFLEEIRRQDAPFGIRIVDATSGETATDAYNFQAFLGEINLATRVFPDGREEWIRGIDFVGTPLNATRNIVAAGGEAVVDNSFCGAESGYVPVSTISPAMVVSELEMQSKPESPYTEYTFPMPWDRGGRGKPAAG